jgi:hypothetical protein
MSLILRFGLSMELLSSYIFLLQLLSLLPKSSSVFSLISTFLQALRSYLQLVLVSWDGLPLYFFYLIKGTFYFQDFCLILFSEGFHIFVQLLLYILFSLFHVSLFFYSVLCFTLVFVNVLSEFIYLFLCLLKFFTYSVFILFEFYLAPTVRGRLQFTVYVFQFCCGWCNLPKSCTAPVPAGRHLLGPGSARQGIGSHSTC